MKEQNNEIKKHELMEVRLLLDLLNLEANANAFIKKYIESLRAVIRESRNYSCDIIKNVQNGLESYCLYMNLDDVLNLSITREKDRIRQMDIYTYKDIKDIVCDGLGVIECREVHQLTKKSLKFRNPDIIIEQDYIAEAPHLATDLYWRPTVVRRYQGDILRTEEKTIQRGRYTYELGERTYDLEGKWNIETIYSYGKYNFLGLSNRRFEKQYQNALALTKERKS